MSRRYDMKKVARIVPGLRRVLIEKDALSQLTRRQKAEIEYLADKNRHLEKALGKRAQKIEIMPQLLKEEVLKAEHRKKTPNEAVIKHSPPFELIWVIPAVKVGSGGQADIFRTIIFLSKRGHNCKIYVFDPAGRSSLAEQKQLIREYYPELKSAIFYNSKKIVDGDAVFATHWITAYPVYNFGGQGRKYYYAQGYEPHTELAGYFNHLVEETYSFSFQGIVLGEWLAEKLSREYKMKCDYFDFGYDPSKYFLTNQPRSRDIFYYAQPLKAHRGFELGMMALEIFHAKNPK